MGNNCGGTWLLRLSCNWLIIKTNMLHAKQVSTRLMMIRSSTKIMVVRKFSRNARRTIFITTSCIFANSNSLLIVDFHTEFGEAIAWLIVEWFTVYRILTILRFIDRYKWSNIFIRDALINFGIFPSNSSLPVLIQRLVTRFRININYAISLIIFDTHIRKHT